MLTVRDGQIFQKIKIQDITETKKLENKVIKFGTFSFIEKNKKYDLKGVWAYFPLHNKILSNIITKNKNYLVHGIKNGYYIKRLGFIVPEKNAHKIIDEYKLSPKPKEIGKRQKRKEKLEQENLEIIKRTKKILKKKYLSMPEKDILVITKSLEEALNKYSKSRYRPDDLIKVTIIEHILYNYLGYKGTVTGSPRKKIEFIEGHILMSAIHVILEIWKDKYGKDLCEILNIKLNTR